MVFRRLKEGGIILAEGVFHDTLVFLLIVIFATSTVTHAQVCCDKMDSDQYRHPFEIQQSQQPGLIPTPNGGALFEPITPNAYGPGLNSDATGRPFIWTQGSRSTIPDPTLQVTPNGYGLGIGMDQYGRPIQPACQPGWAGPC